MPIHLGHAPQGLETLTIERHLEQIGATGAEAHAPRKRQAHNLTGLQGIHVQPLPRQRLQFQPGFALGPQRQAEGLLRR